MPEFKVVGPRRVAGVSPGSTVELPYGDETDHLLEVGHIEVIATPKPAKTTAKKAAVEVDSDTTADEPGSGEP